MLIACFNNANAQEVFVPKPSKFITRFPFVQLSGGVILLKATVDDHQDSLNFILDTGSGGISLDSTTVNELQIPTRQSDRTIRGIAGMRTVRFAYNHTLKIPGLIVDSLNFHINDYELLSGVYGVKIDGIIGFSFMQRYVVRINYDSQQIEIFTNGSFKYPKGGYMLRPTIAGLPMQYANMKDSRSVYTRFFLDTGAGLCLLLSEEFCTDSTLLSAKRKRFKTVTEGLGGKKEMEMTVLSEFKIGPYKFKKVPIYVFDDEYNVTAYPYLAGLIGNDLLRRFNVVINYSAREFHLLPNTHMREAFDYSYSGMGLYAVGNDIIISDVVAGSPADVAGLKAGDIVIGMNNNLSNNMLAYKGMLQLTGSRIKIIIRRDNELIEAKLSIKSIL
ncbi:hypothetical protein BH10BAC3_BH10BAC3_29980 [soil metagenome]